MIPALLLCVAATGVVEVEGSEAKRSVLVLELEHRVEDEEAARLLNRVIADELEELGRFSVLTTEDLRRQIELETERETFGCNNEDLSCMSEIADALGADFVVGGDLGRLGEQVVLTLSVFETARARAYAREVIQARRVEALPQKIAIVVRHIFTASAEDRGQAPVQAPSALAPALLWSGLGALVLGAGAGVGLDLALGHPEVEHKDALAVTEVGAWAVAGLGAVSAVVGGVMLWRE